MGVNLLRRVSVVFAIIAALAGCAEILGGAAEERRREQGGPTSVVSQVPDRQDPLPVPAGPVRLSEDEAEKFPAETVFRGARQPLVPTAPATIADVGGGQVAINFENAELREVIRVVLGDTLKLNYIHDPRVQGVVSLRTAKPMPASAVLSMLETVLRMNNGALIREGDVYKVVPANEAVRGTIVPELGLADEPIPPGYSVRIVPLRNVSATQMSKLLEPFLPQDGLVRIDPQRNLLVVAGTGAELERLIETVSIFDVNYLAGRSVGIYRLSHVAAAQVVTELDAVFGDTAEGPLAGLVRILPLERLNAIMVITSRQEYLDQAAGWIQRLDRGGSAFLNLYVYYLQNGKAGDIARMLTEVFQQEGDGRGRQQQGRVAPGQNEARIEAPPEPAPQPAPREGLLGGRLGAGNQPQGLGLGRNRMAEAPRPRPAAAPRAQDLTVGDMGTVRIIADEINNALLVLASPQAYEMIEPAIRKLDIVPLQVLVEATIAEVTLTDQLRYGLQYFLQNDLRNDPKLTSNTILNTGTTLPIAAAFPGFSWLLAGRAGNPKVILNALENVTRLRVIASPHVMIRDNQRAELQVGNEVPILTQQQQSIAANANVVNTVQYRETGVILGVSPHVNSSGSISLEIEQEVSSVQQQAPGADALTPTIAQRRIKSSVVVQTGETVVLGGLIQQRDNKGTSGIPFLAQLPLIGPLFGTRIDDQERTELLVLISPRVVRDPSDARRITEEIRRRLRGLTDE